MKKFFLLIFLSVYLGTNAQKKTDADGVPNPPTQKLIDSAFQVSYSDVPLTLKIFNQASSLQPKNTSGYLELKRKEIGFLSSIGRFSDAILIADSLIMQDKFPVYKGLGYLEKGIAQSRSEQSDEAIVNLKKALPIFEEYDQPIKKATAFKNLGNILFFMENMGEARKYYRLSARLSYNNGSPIATGQSYNNLSRTFIDTTLVDSAIYYNDKIFKILKENPDYQGELQFMAYLNDMDFQSQKLNFKRATIAGDSALYYAKKLKVLPMEGAVYQFKALLNRRQRDYNGTYENALKALDIFEKTNQQSYIKQTLPLAQTAAAQLGKYEEAYNYAKEYNRRQDSATVEKIDKNLKEVRLKYNATENELQIAEQQSVINKKENQRVLLIIGLIVLAAVGLFSYLIYRQRQQTQEKRIELLENEKENIALKSVIKGEEKERSRIARELHDGLGGILAAARMHASRPDDREKAVVLLDKAAVEARRISHNLLPENLVNNGLDAALTDYVKAINDSAILKVDYQSIKVQRSLPQDLELSIYRIIQELINNVIKHSGATEALIQLHQIDSKLQITIEDNGSGITVNKQSDGIGLYSIKSRLALLKGTMEIDAMPSRGTSVFIEIPSIQ